jgi:hypothetical protein
MKITYKNCELLSVSDEIRIGHKQNERHVQIRKENGKQISLLGSAIVEKKERENQRYDITFEI